MATYVPRLFNFFCLFLGFQSYAIFSSEARAQEANEQKSLLWKVSGNGLTETSYLFGTIHFICEEDYLWPTNFQEALNSCRSIVLELDMDEPGLQNELAQSMMLPEGAQLSDYFSKEQYDQLGIDLQKNAAIPISLVEGLKPFAVLSLLSMRSLSCPIPQSYEGKLMEYAKEQGKEIYGLEEADEQLAVVDNMQTDSLAAAILRYAGEPTELRSQYKELLSFYKDQDINGLNKMISNSPEYTFNLDELLYQRNRNWLPKIASQAKKEATFFAVGAGHLAGEEGVIALLRKTGFTVTPIK